MLQTLAHILQMRDRTGAPDDLLSPLTGWVEKLRVELKGHKPVAEEDDIRAAVVKFRQDLRMHDSRQAVYVSLGCLLPIGPKKQKLIEDTTVFPVVLSNVERYRKHLMVFQDCYKGLLDAYLGYHPEGKRGSRIAWPNWNQLRDWLAKTSADIYDPTFQEDWVNAVRSHPELFSAQPLRAFGSEMLTGECGAYDKFASDLGVSKASWLEEEMVRAMIQGAANSKAGIVPHLPQLIAALRRVEGENKHLFNHGLAEVFTHYYEQSDGEVHEDLRKVALDIWRNPMQDSDNKYAWEKSGWALLDDGPLAMAKAWFASHIIEKFFSVLAKKSEREERDKREKRIRRMKFWVQYAGALTDVKFALGPYASSDNDPRMREVLDLMRGMTLELWGGGDKQNNAFILRFGDWVVVEFGLESNATFIYRASDLPFERGQKAVSTQVIKDYIKHTPPTKNGPIRKEHRDSGAQTWEDDYRDALKKRGILPSRVPVFSSTQSASGKQAATQTAQSGETAAKSMTMTQVETRRLVQIEMLPGLTQIETQNPRPNEIPARDTPVELSLVTQKATPAFSEKEQRELETFCRRFSIPIRDMRRQGGNFWVMHDSDAENPMTALLNKLGFTYRAGKGWWYPSQKDA
ncbi:hypothetical protein AWB78_02427 [Caballeronia calidae]|uniref:Zorya protein ZorC EH domain-containing protein n=1 Tax=Caballeronia calidae TaxID=1777139 RepID=A0A158BB95_9BURK|nr:EH signature domain-containing protein [Caballeronia calidae]SAK66627.1 hypothetical protein AWB78_02427 [Caballeronia calidae]